MPPRLVYVVVRDVCAPLGGGWTEILRAFESSSAAGPYARQQCERQDLKEAAKLLGGAVVRHRIVGRELEEPASS